MKRPRGPNWTTEQTKVLAELKSPGLQSWQEISSIISTKFPKQAKTAKQCRQRWETLKKVYNTFIDYCRKHRRAHTELTKEEIQSLNDATAYDEEWYSFVKEFHDRRPQAGMASEPSNTRSVRDPLQVCSPPRNIQPKASTSGESSKQVKTRIVPGSVEREFPSHIEPYYIAGNNQSSNQSETYGASEIPPWSTTDAKNMRSYQSMDDPKISTASGISMYPPELTAEEKWADTLTETPERDQETEHETERETEQETKRVETVTVPMSVDRSSASRDPRLGAPCIAQYSQPQDGFGPFELPEWGTEDANLMMYMFQTSRASSKRTVMKAEECFQSSEFIHGTDSDSDLQSESCSEGVGHWAL